MIFRVSSIVLLLLLLPVKMIIAENSNAVTLKINIEGIVIHKGQIYIAIYDSDENFMKHPIITRTIPVVDASNAIFIKNLREGDYAITLFQDLDGDGELDKFLSIPLEPYGLSNNPPAYPSFEKLKFHVQGDSVISIQLKN